MPGRVGQRRAAKRPQEHEEDWQQHQHGQQQAQHERHQHAADLPVRQGGEALPQVGR